MLGPQRIHDTRPIARRLLDNALGVIPASERMMRAQRRHNGALAAGLLAGLLLAMLVIGGLLLLAWPTYADPVPAGALTPVALTPELDLVPASLLRGH